MPSKLTQYIPAFFFGICIGFFVFFLTDFDWSKKGKQENKAELISIYELIDVGMPDTEVALRIIKNIHKERIFVDQNGTHQIWYISAPEEFLQSHWILKICFENGISSGVLFGIADDVNVAPSGAPTPKGNC